MALLKQGTTYTRMFVLVQSSDHITGLTGASPSVSISKAGAAFDAAAGTISEVGNGWYKIALTAADTDTLGDLAFHVSADSADPTDFCDEVRPNVLGDTLPVNIISAAGVAWASGAITANVLAGDAITAAKVAPDAGAEIAGAVWANGTRTLTADAYAAAADALLDRDMSAGTDSGSSTVRTVRQALRPLRNKVSVVDTTMTVTKEDDATASWTAVLTTSEAAQPVTGIDPAGP